MTQNSYDSDVITWSPEGKLFQIDYAAEAAKQGGCCVGISTKSHVVMVSLRKYISKLAELNPKIYIVSKNIAVSFSGITSDAETLIGELRNICAEYRLKFGNEPSPQYIMDKISEVIYACTKKSSSRPFGVKLLISAVHGNTVKLYLIDPHGDYDSYKAIAIGHRSHVCRDLAHRSSNLF